MVLVLIGHDDLPLGIYYYIEALLWGAITPNFEAILCGHVVLVIACDQCLSLRPFKVLRKTEGGCERWDL